MTRAPKWRKLKKLAALCKISQVGERHDKACRQNLSLMSSSYVPTAFFVPHQAKAQDFDF